MVSEAKRKAINKYNSEKIKTRTINFSPRESDLLEHLNAQPNKSGYLKELIRKDMEINK